MTLLEAARQALEPLESALEYVEQCINERVRSLGENHRPHVLAAMRKEHADGLTVLATLRAAIEAAAEPEPVAWASSLPHRANQLMSAAQYNSCLPKNRSDFDVPLYAAPPSADAQTERDAARYQWLRIRVCGLRNNEANWHFGFPTRMQLVPVTDCGRGNMGQHLDAAIDAAMATPKKGT